MGALGGVSWVRAVGNAFHCTEPHRTAPNDAELLRHRNPRILPPLKPPNDEIHITNGVRYITCNADYCFYAAAGLGFKAGSPSRG